MSNDFRVTLRCVVLALLILREIYCTPLPLPFCVLRWGIQRYLGVVTPKSYIKRFF